MFMVTKDFCKVSRSGIRNAIANAIGARQWDPMRGSMVSNWKRSHKRKEKRYAVTILRRIRQKRQSISVCA